LDGSKKKIQREKVKKVSEMGYSAMIKATLLQILGLLRSAMSTRERGVSLGQR